MRNRRPSKRNVREYTMLITSTNCSRLHPSYVGETKLRWESYHSRRCPLLEVTTFFPLTSPERAAPASHPEGIP